MTDKITFNDLGLPEFILKAVSDLGFETPSPIQQACIPALLEGRDVLGMAQTGSGKTAAFSLPLLAKIDPAAKHPQLLVMAPTRELAIQVADACEHFMKYAKGINIVTLYGGQRYDIQLRALKQGAQVVVGTPGRILDHIRRNTLNLSELKAIVLDEADEMLRMGFIDDVETVMAELPEEHQTALFSATMPEPIRRITKRFMNNPQEVKIKVNNDNAPDIEQNCWYVQGFRKNDALLRFLEVEEFDAAIIFTRTKTGTLDVTELLEKHGFRAAALNGDMTQQLREQTLDRLRNGSLDIVVATDVAARGIDIERISLVVNYDIPLDAESYVHRIGRTARADRDGKAITFVNEDDIYFCQQVESFLEKEVEKAQLPAELGKGPEYKSNGKPKKSGNSAKSRRRKDRDHQSHKDKKQGNNKQRNRRPAPQTQNNTDENNANQQERKTGNKQNHRPQKQQDNNPAATEGKPVNKKNNRQNKGKQQERQPKAENEKRNDRKPANNKGNAENTTNQQNKKPNNKRKKRNNRQRTSEDKSVRRSTKYDIREELPSTSNNESGLKALIKKPLKWLRGLGKK